MITDALLRLLYTIFSWILSLFPAYSGFPSEAVSAVSYWAGKVHTLDCLLPIDTVKTILKLYMAAALVYALFRFGQWLLHWKQPAG